MNTETTENLSLEIRRTFPVSPERLFSAWTDPEEAKHWFGPEECRPRDFQMDARVGGKYLISIDRDGELLQVAGEFQEVVCPSRLVYTWRWLNDPDWEGIDSIVTVEFTEQAGGTELHLTHERFPSAESRTNHESGWSATLENLGRYLTR